MQSLSTDARIRLIGAAVVLLAAVVFTGEPIPQDQGYHRFADGRSLGGLPNAADVVSNLPLVVIGLVGWRWTWRRLSGRVLSGPTDRQGFPRAATLPWGMFFAAVTLTGLGSAWYHLAPSDATLLWDRLPLSVACATLLAAVLTERIGEREGLLTLPVLVVFGLFSVLYWTWVDDLRYYVALQTAAILVVPLIALLLPGTQTRAGGWFLATGFYLLAKLAELGDAAVFGLGQLVSGHTLKHLLAAAAALALLHMLRTRRPTAADG